MLPLQVIYESIYMGVDALTHPYALPIHDIRPFKGTTRIYNKG